MSERYRKPEPGKSILTGSSHRDHGAHGPGKRTLTDALPHRAPARRTSAPEPAKDDAKDDANTDASTDDRSA